MCVSQQHASAMVDDAITPPQVLHVMPIWCDAAVHLGGEIAVTADRDAHLGRMADKSVGSVLAHGSLNSEEEHKHIVLGQRCISEGHKQIRHVEMRLVYTKTV